MKRFAAGMAGRALLALAFLVAGLCPALLASGCGGSGPEMAAVAVVVDKGATSALADGAEPCIRQASWPVVAGGGHLAVVVASSHPKLVCDTDVAAPGNPSQTALESRWLKDGAFDVAREINGCLPSAEEVDLLESLKLAADAMRTDRAQSCESRTVYIAASGLQTCGLLDFTGRGRYGDILGWDYDELVSRIAADTTSGSIEAEGLPDLTGIHVVWMGFGSLTAGAQGDIPPERLAQMKDLWSRVLVACGAEFDPARDFVNCPTADGGAADRSALPAVTPVVFEETLTVATVTFDENVLGFVKNDDVYRDEADYVASVLSPYAESLKATGASIVVLGTTANDGSGPESCRDLGRRRAERVRDDLVALGVDPAQISVCSAGYEGVGVTVGGESVDFYHDNYNDDGSWNEDVAKQNRAIHIIPADLADDVLARFGV